MGSLYGSLDAYVSALLDTVQTVGIAHVGVGTDLFGLGSTVIPGYEQFAQLEERLSKGLRTEDVRNVLGGNYLRALRAALAA